MPSNYYCADNFFKKMTDLDSPRRNNDCYFYYYSTCAKGDSCTFRHEPSALGCETMCSFWKEGKCLNVHCNFRHMELRKNRKAIQCYWETQPGGCLKPHCPFLHQNVKQSLANYGDTRIGPNTDSAQTVKPSDTVQATEKNYKSSVDSLVVNFEEESDTESAPSPIKIKKANVKTLEEIKLERIQEESAAYFSYHDIGHQSSACEAENDLRYRLLHKMKRKQLLEENPVQTTISKRKKLNFIENASLDDHIKISSTKQNIVLPIVRTEKMVIDEKGFPKKKLKFGQVSKKDEKDMNDIKIKTLAEIRAERLQRREVSELSSQLSQKNLKRLICSESENEVSSTSRDDIDIKILHKIQKVQQSPYELNDQKSTILMNKIIASSDIIVEKDEDIKQEKISTNSDYIKDVKNVIDASTDQREGSCGTKIQSDYLSSMEQKLNILHSGSNPESNFKAENRKNISPLELNAVESENIREKISDESDPLSNKLAEEVLLLDDDEDYANVNLKAEDELLDEIDDILSS